MRGRTGLGLALAVLLGSGLGGLRPYTAGAAEDREEAVVYATLIRQQYGRSMHRPVVIDEAPVSGLDRFVLDDSLKQALAVALAPLSDDALAAYASESSRERALNLSIEGGVPCHMISQAALDTIFSQCPRGWDLLSERHPGCHGYVTLSNIGFGPGRDEAIVYTEDHCGVLCGEGTFIYLTKVDEVWRVEKKLTLWIE